MQAISTREDIRDRIELYADEHHRYRAEIRLVRQFAELAVQAAFASPRTPPD